MSLTANPMTHPVDQIYFEWLTSQIEFPRNFKKTFNELLAFLHDREFVWTISGDDNRAQDALDLRKEFINHGHKSFYKKNFKPYVSILEIVIALSRRLEFIAGGKATEWAWRLLENLRLNHFYDPLSREQVSRLEDILDTLVWRTYKRDGNGGFFPLNWPRDDQTKIELWYQMNAYVTEIQEP